MAAPSNERAMRMAALYVHGPDKIVGDWETCAKMAGYLRVPQLGNATLRKEIEKLGGAVPAVRPKADELKQVGGVTPPPALPSPDEEVGDEFWREHAKELATLYRDVALGNADINPTQRQAIKDIMDRGFGKAGAKRPDKHDLAVVILPALGDGSTTRICPRCQYVLEHPDD